MKKFGICLGLLFAVMSLTGCKDEVVKVGEQAPALSALDLHDNNYPGEAWTQGEYTYLTFWSASCAPCMAELAHLETLSQQYQGKVRVLSINVLSQKPPSFASLPRFAQAYTVLYDPLGITAERYLVQSTPSSYIVDDRGIVRQAHVGMRSLEDLQTLFENMARKELT